MHASGREYTAVCTNSVIKGELWLHHDLNVCIHWTLASSSFGLATHLPSICPSSPSSSSSFSLLPTTTASLSPSFPLLSSSSLSPQFCHLTLDMVAHFMDKYIGCEGAVNVHRRMYCVLQHHLFFMESHCIL